ncbi:N-acetyl-gamma-glutamyl-phosphate reductase [Flexibacterium corallicola]|uniref:N-acetyl-gamma-glutamyl-phosphate reductase n=1 Tax=Flexibacterium corallicola TaxID=3037259 RepID=UPI00286F84FB|nr:N-acetyl-gamma-glutamyl-phosphate reductase [Pseudovibrio sp. M1P-2-3]
MSVRIFIDGEAGTTGLQIREQLEGRSDIELLQIAPELRKDVSARADLLNLADVAILCLPDEAAKESVSLLENTSTRVIDASTAYRVNPDWAYGFPELSREHSKTIEAARFVSNPGCYPQGVIATVRPLIEAGLLPSDAGFSVNAISGYSGGGRQMIETYKDNPTAPAYMPYALTLAHKHLPEMQQYSKMERAPLFQPAVGNYAQGMVTAIPLQLGALNSQVTGKELHAAIADYYSPIDGFVEVAPFEAVNSTPALNPEAHNGTNTIRLHVFANDDNNQAVLMAVYDNLGKGASGAAVQNLNLMLGMDQATSLRRSV